jgi:hypothetical protein
MPHLLPLAAALLQESVDLLPRPVAARTKAAEVVAPDPTPVAAVVLGATSASGAHSSVAAGGGQGALCLDRPHKASTAPQASTWSMRYNPWTGMVQAWPMPFQALALAFLGHVPRLHHMKLMLLRPSRSTTTTTDSFVLPVPPSTSTWDQSALLAALNSVVAQPNSTSDWYLDSGASAYMASHPGILTSSIPNTAHHSIVVGNGSLLHVSHIGFSLLQTLSSLLCFNNVLVFDSLIKNLISVHKLTHDNWVSVKFDPFGFSIKDL